MSPVAIAITGLGAVSLDGAGDAGKAPLERSRNLNAESALLLAAAQLAIADAGGLGEQPAEEPREQFGIVVATRHAGLHDYAELFRAGSSGEVGAVSPSRGPLTGLNAPAALLSIRLGARGPNMTLSNGAVGALDALAWAAQALRDGDAQTMLVGAVEVALRIGSTPGYVPTVEPTPRGSAAAIVLEAEARARRRGRTVRARLGAVASAFSSTGDLLEASRRSHAAVLADAPAGPIATALADDRGDPAAVMTRLAAAVRGLEHGALLVHTQDEDCAAAAALLHGSSHNGR